MSKIEVLDHGYVQLVESWGSDERIIEAARMSTQKGFEGWGPTYVDCPAGCDGTLKGNGCPGCNDTGKQAKAGDERLLRYLWTHEHSTPFEFAGAHIEVQAPVFVFRQWHRHRTQSYSEMSARYAPVPEDNYMPTVERVLTVNEGNKQAGRAKDAMAPTAETVADDLKELAEFYEMTEAFYRKLLSRGWPKELARITVTHGKFVRMRANANLLNWLKFLGKRMPADAQWETQQYANAVHDILTPLFPRTVGLFDEGRS